MVIHADQHCTSRAGSRVAAEQGPLGGTRPGAAEPILMKVGASKPLVSIACGGTGGHLFPGLAVGRALIARGCDVQLLISPKEVDQTAVKSITEMSLETLPAVALVRGRRIEFFRAAWRSFRSVRKLYRVRPPAAVLAMGGFTSAPPIFAGRKTGAATFLHESNTLPGRANRWLTPWVDQIFVGFPSAAARFRSQRVRVTGTPVRPEFRPSNPASCRLALGLRPGTPTLLITGGSQGASGLNDLVLQAMPFLVRGQVDVQCIHLTGPNDRAKVEAAYRADGVRALVLPFLEDMPSALGAATVAISRAGASSLAELAAMRVPAVLVPYPIAADNHQLFNARAWVDTGAALLLEQGKASGEQLAALVQPLLSDDSRAASLRTALAQWHVPDAARQIAECMLTTLRTRGLLPVDFLPTQGTTTADESTHFRTSEQPA